MKIAYVMSLDFSGFWLNGILPHAGNSCVLLFGNMHHWKSNCIMIWGREKMRMQKAKFILRLCLQCSLTFGKFRIFQVVFVSKVAIYYRVSTHFHSHKAKENLLLLAVFYKCHFFTSSLWVNAACQSLHTLGIYFIPALFCTIIYVTELWGLLQGIQWQSQLLGEKMG